ncbi:hypothetical protein ACTMTJ_31770 [Phytohabitans sp. LJ34]|uniref:hypothetical protein n=1 Tax=Phytohabitans sp. LJ34 TaxID=3452217 RepID=UPI003F8A95D6
MAEDIDGLRARLAGMRGPARTHTLHDLARLLADRYWRTGPGKSEALPDLQEATEALTEAYGYFEPGDELRGMVAAQLGWLLAARHTAHGGLESDRETGIERLLEGLAYPRLPPAMVPIARLMLGQLYMSRVTGGFIQGAMTLAVRPGKGSRKQADDARRAAECFRQVLAESSLGPQITAAAEAMLTLAEALASMFGGVPGFDPGTVTRAAQALQRLRKQSGGPLLSMGSRMAGMDPLDRPVVVMDGPATTPAAPRPRPAAPVTDTEALRQALRERLGADAEPCAAAGALLADGAPPTDVDTADELVALATTVVHAGPAVATDHLLLAVALMLRGRADDGPGAAADADAALDSVRAATADVRSLPAPAFTLLLRLSIYLAHRDTAGIFRRTLAEIASALRRVGADALACPQPSGMVLLHAASGRVSLGTERSLPRRTLVVGDRPPAAGIAIVSTIASHAQLLDLATRQRRPVTEEPVFVVDPRADRERATAEVEPLKRCYPRAEVLTGGTASAVLARRGAALLHLACAEGPDGALRLAGGTELRAEAIAAAGRCRPGGGLVVLPATGAAFPALADAFLATGCAGVIGWLRPVSPRVASTVYLALHTRLARQPQEPAAVVHAVRRWLRDPDRKPLPGFTAHLTGIDTRDVASALAHRGI